MPDRTRCLLQPVAGRATENNMHLTDFFTKKSRVFSIIVGFVLIGIVGYVDYITGRDVSFAIFYLVPIAYITWYTGRPTGTMASLASALTWFFDEYTGTDLSLHPTIPYWNAAGMLGFFLAVTYILAELKDALRKEKEMSGRDHLTGAANSGAFSEAVSVEIKRLEKFGHPFSVAYFDIDDLKKVNNALGRSTGDELLRQVVRAIGGSVRKVDTIARMGGDEFAILLPETNCDYAAATIGKVRENLLLAMSMHDWPVTFSIGVVTFVTPPGSVDDIMKRVDVVMHGMKDAGKNEIRHETVVRENPAS